MNWLTHTHTCILAFLPKIVFPDLFREKQALRKHDHSNISFGKHGRIIERDPNIDWFVT